MPKLTIDGVEIEVPDGSTVLQACEFAGKEIPRFCYHDRLSVAGNCRMCLVEMERSPKPIASCAMPAAQDMVIRTDTPGVRKARQGVMEFLLINHPLDCPICDQGGECDLQDQAMAYGFDRSRYDENKRAVTDKYMGPLIKTIMTRCIQCTRCVRFATEVAGVEEMGLVNRGEHAEITTLEKALDSELSGNLVDICPVGALTSKPYAFKARPWELQKTPSVDVHDAVGSNIRVDTRGREVMRVLPRLHEDINEEWIADKTRHACDGLLRQRLDRPYLRGADGKLAPATWADAFGAIAERLKSVKGEAVAALAGDLCDAESMLALKQLMERLGSPHLDCRQDGARLSGAPRGSYLFNTTIAGIERADACLLVGSDPRWEAPLVNARLRKRFLRGGFHVASIGPALDLTFAVEQLGEGVDALRGLAGGDSAMARVLEDAERPMIVLGMGALARPDGSSILGLGRGIAERYGMLGEDWNGFNVLHTAAARVGGLDLGFLPGEGGRDTAGILAGSAEGDIEVLFLLGADEVDMTGPKAAFTVYIGHHGDAGAHAADVILPGAAYTEKNGTYVNTEGRVQLGRLAGSPPGDAREDWSILRALSERLGRKLPYDNLGALRQALIETNPLFARLNRVEPGEWGEFGAPDDKSEKSGGSGGSGGSGAADGQGFALPIRNYYMTDAISRASETMAQCTATFLRGDQDKRTGTDG